MLRARRGSTNRLYGTYLRKWADYCDIRSINYHSPSIPEELEFLQQLLQEPHSHRDYSALCTARSALNAVLILPNGQKFWDHPHVKQFIKGVFNTDPPKPGYTTTWDPNVITKMLKSWYPATKLNMLRLTKKIVMLILIITGQRGQILTALNVERMCIRPDYFIFELRNSDIKQGRQNYKPEPIRLKAYPDKRPCIVHCLKIYLERTLHVRQAEKQLLRDR